MTRHTARIRTGAKWPTWLRVRRVYSLYDPYAWYVAVQTFDKKG